MTIAQRENLQKILTRAHEDYSKGLILYASFKIADPVASEDLVQDTFLKTWNYLVRGGKISVMKAFLYHVLNQLIIDQYRKRKPVSLDTLVEKGFNPYTDQTEKLINEIDGRKYSSYINKLPDKYRTVVEMKYMQSLSLKEISTRTKLSRNTSAVQAHRGIERLKQLVIVSQLLMLAV